MLNTLYIRAHLFKAWFVYRALVLVRTISYSQVYLLKTKWVATHIFSAQILAYMPYIMIKVSDALTNDIVSFEQLGPIWLYLSWFVLLFIWKYFVHSLHPLTPTPQPHHTYPPGVPMCVCGGILFSWCQSTRMSSRPPYFGFCFL